MPVLPFLVSLVLASQTLSISDMTNGQLWACHVPEKMLTVLSIDPYEYKGYTFDIFRLDRNADGAQDMLLMYATNNKKRAPFPIYYIYDKDFDGKPDIAYRDTQGNGICQQMEELDPARLLTDKDA